MLFKVPIIIVHSVAFPALSHLTVQCVIFYYLLFLCLYINNIR